MGQRDGIGKGYDLVLHCYKVLVILKQESAGTFWLVLSLVGIEIIYITVVCKDLLNN